MIENSNNEINVPYKLFLTDSQVSKIHKAFANGSSANIKFSKTRLSKMIQSGGILPFLLNGNSFIKASEGVLSLVNSVLNESKNMDAKKIEN